MKNPLFTRLPFHRTPVSIVLPEQLANRAFAPNGFDRGAITPKYRLPEFVIQRSISALRISDIKVVTVADGTLNDVTFDQATETFYHQNDEYQFAAFKGQDLGTAMDCGVYYYRVQFEGESDWYYSQYFRMVDIQEGVVPIGYVRFKATADCRMGDIPHDKWDGFYHELWFETDETRPEVLTERLIESDEENGQDLTGVRIDRTVSIGATCSLGEADLAYLLQAYTLKTLEYYRGKDGFENNDPDIVRELTIDDSLDYTVGEEDPYIRMKLTLDVGLFGSYCCGSEATCDPYTVTPSYSQSGSTITTTLPSADYPSGMWVVIQYRRDDATEWTTHATEFTEAEITGPGGSVTVPPFPSDNFIFRVIVQNFGDCIYTSEESGLFAV